MIIRSLRVQNIRAHGDFAHQLSPDVTVITGSNGSGKTSLLEALIVALQGSSFKGTDSELLRYGAPWWRIDVAADTGARTVKFDPSRQTGRKQFVVDDKTNYRMLPANKYPVVLFEPDDLRLLAGSPTRRRQFIDRFIAQIDPLYPQVLRKYERALKQRNNLLKRAHVERDDLFVWDIALGEYGAAIIEARIRAIEHLNADLGATYGAIAQTNDMVAMHYSHTVIGDTKQRIVNELHAHADRDRILGYTSVGPHRHDVVFKFNDVPALAAASRGEVRSIVLALKFLEVDTIHDVTGQKPVVLLDDVFSELDSDRQTHLTTKFGDKQIIMTSASSTARLDGAMVIHLE